MLSNAKLCLCMSKLLWEHAKNYSSQIINQLLSLGKTDVCSEAPSRGLIIGIYYDEEDKLDPGLLTPAGFRYNELTEGRLIDVIRMSGKLPGRGQSRVMFAVETKKPPDYSAVVAVGLGKHCSGYNTFEVIDENKENIRRSVANACMRLSKLGTQKIDIDPCGHAESAAEGAVLGIWQYQELKDPKHRIDLPLLELYTNKHEECDLEGWRIGSQKAAAQNLCRELQEAPPNHLTPTAFAEKVIQVLCRTGVNVEVKTEGWCEHNQMTGFLSVGKGSCEPPMFLELSYTNAPNDEKPIVLVGQGITYDCGGLCLKEKENLKIMRGNMTGAAVVVATCKAISALRLPINIRGLIPLCENVLGCNSYRPGDSVKLMNGMNVGIQSTDNEEVIVMADALYYAQNYCPKCVVDIGTFSVHLREALDEAASAVFTNSEVLWQQIKNASIHTGDRVWRMPLWNYYKRKVTESSLSTDIQNVGFSHNQGNPCKAAAFLYHFISCGHWMHIDAANTMYTRGTDYEYLTEGMTGRPTRTMIEFVAQTLCKDTAPKLK